MFDSLFDKGMDVHVDPMQKAGFDRYMAELNNFGEKAGGVLENVFANPTYQGDMVAARNPYQEFAYQQVMPYAQGMFGQSQDLMANNLAQMNQLQDFGSMLANYNRGMQDPNAAFNYATQFSQDPTVNAMIDAATRDVTRNLYEGALPNIDRAAVGTGNTNNNRVGLAEGVVRRGAEDRVSDIGAGIRNNAFAQGLTQYNTNKAAQLTGLNAMGSAYGNLNNLFGNAYGMGGQALDAINAAGQSMFGYDQSLIDAQMRKFYETQDRPMAMLQQYMQPYQGASAFSGAHFQEQPSAADNIGQALEIGGQVASFFG